MTVRASAGGSVTRTGPGGPYVSYKLQLAHVPARAKVTFNFLTSLKNYKSRDLDMFSPMMADFYDPPNLMHYIIGNYAFFYRNATIAKPFFVALHYDRSGRHITSDPVASDRGEWQLIKRIVEPF